MLPKAFAAALLVALSGTAALAQSKGEAVESRQQEGFLGLSIPLTGDMRPRVTIGLRRATVGTDGSLRGGELRLDVNPRDPRDVQFRAMALKGRVTGAGAIGGGWDFGTGRAFATGGAVLPHLSALVDIGTTPRLAIGLDSLDRFDTPVAPVLVDHCGNPRLSGQPAPRC